MSSIKRLSAKQEQFAVSVGEMEFDYPWKSYEKFYSTANMSKTAVYVESCRLLQNPKVSKRVAEIRAEIRHRHEVTLDEVLEEMAKWIRFDPIDMVDSNGCLKQMQELPEVARKNLSSPIEIQEIFEFVDGEKVLIGYLKRARFVDRSKVAEMYLKKFGAFVKQMTVEVNDLQHIKDLVEGIEKAKKKAND